MIDLFIKDIIHSSLWVFILVMLSLYAVTIYFWSEVRERFHIKNYRGVQRAHEGEVPRIGGLISFIGLIIYGFLWQHAQSLTFINTVLVSSIPTLVVSVKEDFFQNTRTSSRLLAMWLSCLLFFYCYPVSFPFIEFPGLSTLLGKYPMANYLFFSLAVVVIMNGNNLIDGANGLMPMSVIMQSLCLFYLCYLTEDSTNLYILIFIITPMTIFLIFNYPWGKVFMGDFGAYFFGFIISLSTIKIFGDHPELPTWVAVMILFYPAWELLFSFCRKVSVQKNPMMPDHHHLHLKMYHFLNKGITKPRVCNGMVMPCLALIWIMPFVLLVWVYHSLILTLFALLLIIIIYLGFYWALPRKKN